MQIIKYRLKSGEIRYMVKGHIGIDDRTGKRMQISRYGFRTKTEAKTEFNRIQYEFDLNKHFENERIKYEELFTTWKKIYKKTVKESTFKKTMTLFRIHILPRFEDKYINKIRPIDCQEFIEYLSQYVNGKQTFRYAKMPMDYAIKTDMIGSNPFDKVIYPKFKKKRKVFDFLSAKESKKLLDVIDDPFWHCYFRLLIYTGIRKSEGLALNWSDVNFDTSILSINKTISLGNKNQIIVQSPKTSNSIRDIIVDSETLMEIHNLKKSANSFIIFSDQRGKHLYPARPGEWLSKYLKKAGLRHIRVHDLRHTHASLLFESGADIKAVQERLGHSNIQTTMDVYTHVTEDNKEKTILNFIEYMG